MNENKSNSLSVKESKESIHKDIGVSTENNSKLEDVRTATAWSTYETFSWFYSYTKLFTQRMIKDLLITLVGYIYSGQIIPQHIADLISVQKSFITERESQSVTYRREDDENNYVQISMRSMFNAIKTYIISSEDDIAIQCTSRDLDMKDREPMFVIVDSSCHSEPSSREILIEGKIAKPSNNIHKKIQPIDMPSTSTDTQHYVLEEIDSSDELMMVDINLQSENEIDVDNEIDNDSIVLSYLRNKSLPLNFEGTLLASKKKLSLLEDLSKMDTIIESETFSELDVQDNTKNEGKSTKRPNKLSESSLDVFIPSYPGSPRSLEFESETDQSLTSFLELSNDYRTPKLQRALDFLHEENEFLEAACNGNVRKIEQLISNGANIHATDHIGRNALHFAICSGSKKAVSVLLKAGVDPNVKDNVGRTPLSLCLWRCPSINLLQLLFKRGAIIIPRSNVMDSGLFLQFIMMCTPTEEEEKIIYLLVDQGALVNDPDAPGGRQALHLAAMSNNCALIGILYSLGANLYLTNINNQTAKEIALVFKSKEAYALLEELEDKFVDSISFASGKSSYAMASRKSSSTSVASVNATKSPKS